MRFRGWEVHTESVGDDGGAGSPMVLLHGFASGSFTWGPAVRAGLCEGRRAVAFDRFGFGRTERPGAADAYSLRCAVELTEAVMDGVGAPAVLVGHSAGALVALAAALAAPRRVAALVLVAPAVIGGGPPPFVSTMFRVPGARRWAPAMLRAGRPFLGRSVAMAWHDRRLLTRSGMAEAYAATAREPRWAEGLVELSLAMDPAAAEDVVRRLGEVAAPVLAVAGAHDRLLPAAAMAGVAARVQNGRLEVLDGCGHVPHEEAPDAFVAVARAFLDGVG